MPTVAFTRIVQLLSSRCGETLTLTDLAMFAGMPKTSLTRQFNDHYRLSPMRWVWLVRTVMAAELIAAAPKASLHVIAATCGFKSQAHFCRRFALAFHESPARFRRHFNTGRTGHTLPIKAALEQAVRKVNRAASAGTDQIE